MVLVDYSDSESDHESTPSAPKPQLVKPAFQKLVDRSTSGKIKVDLPSLKPEPGQQHETEPPAKRARTGGAFSGFNSLLPPPKRAAKTSLKPGVSLNTSSEAAFSREAPRTEDINVSEKTVVSDSMEIQGVAEKSIAPPEPKLIGKATRFVPLSVANKKKKFPNKASVSQKQDHQADTSRFPAIPGATNRQDAKETEQSKPKPKRSLFMTSQEDETTPSQSPTIDAYEPLLERSNVSRAADDSASVPDLSAPFPRTESSSLEAVASDLDLTAAQRRQLFGRHGKDVNIAHFNMEAEYASNEELRKTGEIVQHRAVKAIAPGKHSLQQLVNNAKSQKDAMEDAWAEGRKNRGEGGSKYGWA